MTTVGSPRKRDEIRPDLARPLRTRSSEPFATLRTQVYLKEFSQGHGFSPPWNAHEKKA